MRAVLADRRQVGPVENPSVTAARGEANRSNGLIAGRYSASAPSQHGRGMKRDQHTLGGCHGYGGGGSLPSQSGRHVALPAWAMPAPRPKPAGPKPPDASTVVLTVKLGSWSAPF